MMAAKIQQRLKTPKQALSRLENHLLFLSLFLLPTQLGRHFWPDFSNIFSLKIDYFAPRIYLWDILVLALIALWLINGSKTNRTAIPLFLIFILTQLISLINATNAGASLVRLEQLLIVGLFGIYIASINLKEKAKFIFYGVILAVFLQSVLAFGQFLKGGSIGLWVFGERSFSLSTLSIAKFDWFGKVLLRPYGTFPHPNVLAAYLVLVIPLIVTIRDQYLKKDYLAQLFSNISLVAGSLVTVLTFSRANILVLVVEIFYLLRKKLTVFLILLLVSSPFIYVRYNSAFNFDYLSVIRREELSAAAVGQFMTSPLFGVGLNNFIVDIANSVTLSGESRFLQPVHNIFLLSLAETGVVGLLGLLGLLGYPLYKLYRDRQNPFSKTLLCCFLIIAFLGMLDHYFLTLAQGQRLLFLIWGLSLASLRVK